MQLMIIPVSSMYVNCYLYFDEITKDAVLIDPGKDEDKLILKIKENGLNLVAILLTHGHFDHISAVNEIKEVYDVPVIAHVDELDLLWDPDMNESKKMGWHSVSVGVDRAVKENDEIAVGNGTLHIIHTPGHTNGGICFYDKENGILFAGDSLFFESVGRTDLKFGNEESLIRSLKEKILTLPDYVKVLPGHGRATTIGHEKERNPFLKG